MKITWKKAAGAALAAAGYIIWQKKELKKFRISQYEMASKKINHDIKLVVISDLHSFSYGKDNDALIRAVCAQKPDLILLPGDLIVSREREHYDVALNFVRRIAPFAPVIFSNGNHESKASEPLSDYYRDYQAYRRRLEAAGVIVLNNESRDFTVRGACVRVSGLELPLSAYRKWKKPHLESGFISQKLGVPEEGKFQILLAHHPAFAEQYAAWGADVSVCGHNHGGLIRIPGIGSVISPQFMLFPKYDAGEFRFGDRRVYVSRGLGTHTFHIRIFNRAELLCITVKGKNGSKKKEV